VKAVVQLEHGLEVKFDPDDLLPILYRDSPTTVVSEIDILMILLSCLGHERQYFLHFAGGDSLCIVTCMLLT
jgi:hypothetical protein